LANLHFDCILKQGHSPLTFQTINFQSLIIYEIQFWSQNLFSLFFGSWFEREKRKWLDSSGKERVSVETDFIHENRWFRCQWVPMDGKSLFKVFFPLNLLEIVDLNLKRILISSWLGVLEPNFGLLEVMDIFYKVFKVFFFKVKIWLKMSFYWYEID
jgi:hypothetical protein